MSATDGRFRNIFITLKNPCCVGMDQTLLTLYPSALESSTDNLSALQTVNNNNNIQLLTIEYSQYIISASVNIGTLRSISHHVQCLNSQQLFYYIISQAKKATTTTTTKSWLWTVSWTVLNFFFLHDD